MLTKNGVSSRKKGIVLAVSAAIFWGVSGTVAQYLFDQGFTVEWLVSIRLLVSGLILLSVAGFKQRQNILAIWKHKWDVLRLSLFSIFGMLGVQYTYFAAISYSNAATATVLQYLAPVLIVIYLSTLTKRLPSLKEISAIVLALLGTFLLVTQGSIQSLSISGVALFWGIGSAVALSFYTLQPYKLLARWQSNLIIGWGMLIGGISFSVFYHPWNIEGQWSFSALFAVIFIIVFGTILAFYFYLESLKFISPSEASLLVSIEPLSAAFLSIVWLNVVFGLIEWIGTVCIICTVFILSMVKNKNKMGNNKK